MEEFPSNAHKTEKTDYTAEKRMSKVVSGAVKTKKKSDLQKFINVFISEDIVDVKSYLIKDVLVPTIKTTIMTVVDMMFNGDIRGKGGPNRPAVRVSYNDYYDRGPTKKRPSDENAKVSFNYDELVFADRGDAEAVLRGLREAIGRFGTVSVGDLYDMAEVTCDYTAYNYGWMDLQSAYVFRGSQGYTIKLPRAMPLN